MHAGRRWSEPGGCLDGFWQGVIGRSLVLDLEGDDLSGVHEVSNRFRDHVFAGGVYVLANRFFSRHAMRRERATPSLPGGSSVWPSRSWVFKISRRVSSRDIGALFTCPISSCQSRLYLCLDRWDTFGSKRDFDTLTFFLFFQRTVNSLQIKIIPRCVGLSCLTYLFDNWILTHLLFLQQLLWRTNNGRFVT